MAPVAEPWPGSGITPPFDAYNPRLGADGDRLATICNIYKKSSDDHDGGDDLREGQHLELGDQDDDDEDDDLLHLDLYEVMTIWW